MQIKKTIKWEHGFSPIIEISHYTIEAFLMQYLYHISILKGLLSITFQISNNNSDIKIGIFRFYILLGHGFDHGE